MKLDPTLTVEEVKKQTLKMLNSNDESLVAHINEEYLASDFSEVIDGYDNENKFVPPHTVYYGWDTSYVRLNDGRMAYAFASGGDGKIPGTSTSTGCGGYKYVLVWDMYDHNNTPHMCGYYSMAEFVRK